MRLTDRIGKSSQGEGIKGIRCDSFATNSFRVGAHEWLHEGWRSIFSSTKNQTDDPQDYLTNLSIFASWRLCVSPPNSFWSNNHSYSWRTSFWNTETQRAQSLEDLALSLWILLKSIDAFPKTGLSGFRKDDALSCRVQEIKAMTHKITWRTLASSRLCVFAWALRIDFIRIDDWNSAYFHNLIPSPQILFDYEYEEIRCDARTYGLSTMIPQEPILSNESPTGHRGNCAMYCSPSSS